MTRLDWFELTADERRVKVAKLCGCNTDRRVSWRSTWEGIPDYLVDLNAMYMAERLIEENEMQIDYMNNILDVSKQWAICHATAAQRAEAFVLTMEPS